MARKKINIRKQHVNLNIESFLMEEVAPYIDNLSAFVNQCLWNYYNSHIRDIQADSTRTAKMILENNYKNDNLNNSPNITYIMNNSPIKLVIFELINNRVLGKKKKVITYPRDNLFLISNNILQLEGKNYYYEMNEEHIKELTSEI